MSLLNLFGAVTGGITDIFTNKANVKAQEEANEKNRQFQMDMYDKQRKDALADVQMQNNYNSPAAQMERLKAAGLNPNLVYENGGATTQSAAVRSSSAGSNYATAPRVDYSHLGDTMSQFVDLNARTAQTDNIKANTKVATQDAILRAAQTAQVNSQAARNDMETSKTSVDVERAKFDLGLARQLRETSIEQAIADLHRSQASNQVMLDQNERAHAMQAPNLQIAISNVLGVRLDNKQKELNMSKTTEEIERIRQDIENLKIARENALKDGRLKDLDINLRSGGLNWTDPVYLRMIGNAVDSYQNGSSQEVLDTLRAYLGGKGTYQQVGNSFKKN